MKTNIKRIIFIVAALLVWCGSFFLVQRLLVPKYMDDLIEGALTAEYYDETTEHDVIFIGDCEVYENFSPITLWEEYGITSYIRGNAQQLIWQSYYMLEDVLRYEKPEVVVFNVLSMKYGEPQSEEYNRLALDGMELSPTKIEAVNASMTEDEELITYIFPLLRYHSRWNQLSGEDIRYMFRHDKISHNGFVMRADVRAAGAIPEPEPLADYSFSENCWKYLDMMTALCRENDIELVLIKAPSLYPAWYDEWDAQIVEYAEKNGLEYINLLDKVDEIGIDFYSPETADTYDNGLHLNLSGAEKLSSYFGNWLLTKFELSDHRTDSELAAVWQEKIDFYYYMKHDQLEELEKYGELISY
ncbi:MAG: SGNH/GDSL hydrolase family protein [Ruminococcaceae bacterium]|nr:SGNH/GDSL hydrolase family protein [Oscillospiraceae bacterium]